MLRKRRTGAAKVNFVAVFLLGFHLMLTETSPLKETSKLDGQKKVTDTSGFRPGVIVFGKGLRNESVADDVDYQADFQGLTKGNMFDFHHKFNLMGPKLECGPNQMRFKAFGAPARHFTLGQAPHLPLSHVSSSCGYSIEGYPPRLVLHVPYDGCNIVIQDGNYNLPLLWNGIPVTLKCPRPDGPSTTVAPTLPPWIPGIFSQIPPELLHHLLHHMPGLWPYYWQWLQQQGQTTTASPPQNPLPIDFWLFYWQWLQQQGPSTTASPPQNPSDFLSFYLQWLMQQGQSTTASPPQNPSDFSSFYWLWLMQQGQSNAASPQNPSDIWQYWQQPHPFPYPNPWPGHKGKVSPTNPQIPWVPTQIPWVPTQIPWDPTQMPWKGHKWVFPTTTTSQTPWWHPHTAS